MWNCDLDHHSTSNCDLDHHSTSNCDLDHHSTWNCEPDIIQRRIMTRGHKSTWNHQPGPQFNVESLPRVTIQGGIMNFLACLVENIPVALIHMLNLFLNLNLNSSLIIIIIQNIAKKVLHLIQTATA